MINTAEKDDINDNILNFDDKRAELATKGKTPPGHEDWLSKIDIGAVILVQLRPGQHQSRMFLTEYMISDKTDFAVEFAQKNQVNRLWVDPKEFCKTFELFETLNAPEESE